MEVTIQFEDGPLQAEITAEDGDDFKSALDSLKEFVDDYEPLEPVGSGGTEPSTEDSLENNTESAPTSSSEDSGLATSDDPLVANTEVPNADLQRILKMGKSDGDEIEEFPKIIGDTDVLGDSSQEKVLNGTAIILTILDDLHGRSRVGTSDLKDALDSSGINEDNWGNMTDMPESDVYFTRRGQGSSATTEIREPGKEKAYEKISDLAENLGNSSDA